MRVRRAGRRTVREQVRFEEQQTRVREGQRRSGTGDPGRPVRRHSSSGHSQRAFGQRKVQRKDRRGRQRSGHQRRLHFSLCHVLLA